MPRRRSEGYGQNLPSPPIIPQRYPTGIQKEPDPEPEPGRCADAAERGRSAADAEPGRNEAVAEPERKKVPDPVVEPERCADAASSSSTDPWPGQTRFEF